MRKLLHIILIALTSIPGIAFGQKSEKNLRFSILGGPGYTPDYGVLLGGAGLFTFSMDKDDQELQRSVMPISFAVTFSKPIGLNLFSKPQFFFKEDKMRLWGTFSYKNVNENYYGIGYARNSSIEKSKHTTQYFATSVNLNPVLQFRLADSDFFLGPMIDYSYEKISKVGSFVREDPVYQAQGGDSTGVTLHTMGLGLALSYDTRDVAANAYRGVYFEFKGGYYDPIIGSDSQFGYFSIDYRQYKRLPFLGKRSVLSWTALSRNAFGDIPFTKYPQVGSANDLRGYYLGQYRDKSALLGIAEYRHQFNFGEETRAQRFFSRFGYAAWAGIGVLGKNPIHYDAVLPNFGAGLRIELQPRMNFRLDVGYSPIDKQTLIYFNMTEAF